MRPPGAPPRHLEGVEFGAGQVVVGNAHAFLAHAIGRVGVHQLRLAPGHQARHVFGARRVAAHDAMLAAQPHVAFSGDGLRLEFGHGVGVARLAGVGRAGILDGGELFQFLLGKAQQRHVEALGRQPGEFGAEHVFVPTAGDLGQLVVGDHVGGALRLGPAGAVDDRHAPLGDRGAVG